MSLIVLSFKIEDGVKAPLSKANMARAAKDALRTAAELWRDKILPERFLFGTQNQYQFDQRTQIYLRIIKRIFGQGEGKSANLLLRLKGTSFRFAQYFSTITATGNRATITMKMPAYFTNPQIGTVYENGRRKQIRRQPDKVRELTQMTRSNVNRLNMRATEVYLAYLKANDGSWEALGAKIDSLQTITTVIQ